jgi:hypothetical protein
MIFKYFCKKKQKDSFIELSQKDESAINYHLIFHIYCLDHEKTHYAIEKLKNSLNIFNGYKIITVSSPDNEFHNNRIFQKVVDIFKSSDIYIIPVSNSDKLKESEHFFYKSAPLMSSLLKKDQSKNFVFFGHAKGCSHPEKNYAMTCWVNTLWKYNIDLFHNLVKPQIESNRYEFVGCLRTTRDCYFNSKFHYSGTFFWFDANLLQNENWHKPHNHLLSLEMWPGLISDISKSLSLFDCGDENKYQDGLWKSLAFNKRIDQPHTVPRQ